METAKVSSGFRVVLPKRVREAAGIEIGDDLFVDEEAGKIVIAKKPKSYAEYSLGRGARPWRGQDARENVAAERMTWEKDANRSR